VSQTEVFIERLKDLKEGERSRLRRLAGQPLDATLRGFDLFTGLWWPLRQASPAAPRREPSWLVAKLYGAFPVPDIRGNGRDRPTLARILGLCEPPCPAFLDSALLSSAPPDRASARAQFLAARRFRRRFDALLSTPLSGLEPHLRWALSVVAEGVTHSRVAGVDWARMLDDLSVWDRGEQHRRQRDVRDAWAEDYLEGTRHTS